MTQIVIIHYVLKCTKPRDRNNPSSNIDLKYISAPYIKGCSERVQRILQPHQIKIAHKPSNTIKSKLCHLKDPRVASEKNHSVYKIDCINCVSSYIGETSKKVEDRVKEHRRNIITGNEQS